MNPDAALAASLAVLVYLNTLPNGYVFDDRRAIERNPLIHRPIDRRFFRELATTDFWGTPLSSERSHHSYRPLAVLSLRIDALVAERCCGSHAAAAVTHAANALLHAFSTSLLWLHARAGLRGRAAPLAAALIHAMHPINSEAVSYGVGRADVLAAALGLAGWWFHAFAGRGSSHRPTLLRYRLAASLCLALALAAKETAVMLLPACVVGDVVQHIAPPMRQRSEGACPQSRYRRARTLVAGWLPLLMLGACFGWSRVAHAGPIGNRFRRLDNPIPSEPSARTRLLSTAALHARSMGLLLWPATLSADYSYDALPLVRTVCDPLVGLALAAYASIVFVSIALVVLATRPHHPPSTRRRARAALAWVAVLTLTYLPASHVVLPLSFVIAERLLYLPCAAAALLAATALAAARARGGRWRHAARALLAAALVASGARTMRRSLDWRDDLALFSAAAATYPRSAKAVYQVADQLVQRQREAEARPLLRKALQIEPNYHYAYLHLARLALTDGDPAAAADLATASLRAVPSPNPHGHALAAQAHLELSRRGAEGTRRGAEGARRGAKGAGTERWSHALAAVEHARAAVAADPRAADAVVHTGTLGDALVALSRWDEAAAAFAMVSALSPSEPIPRTNSGAALLRLGRPEEAASAFRHALRLHRHGAAGAPASPHSQSSERRAQQGLAMAERALHERATAAHT